MCGATAAGRLLWLPSAAAAAAAATATEVAAVAIRTAATALRPEGRLLRPNLIRVTLKRNLCKRRRVAEGIDKGGKDARGYRHERLKAYNGKAKRALSAARARRRA